MAGYKKGTPEYEAWLKKYRATMQERKDAGFYADAGRKGGRISRRIGIKNGESRRGKNV